MTGLDNSSEGDDNDGEDAAAEERRKKRITELIESSGLFVARISDKDKQELLKTKQAAKRSARAVVGNDPEAVDSLSAEDVPRSTDPLIVAADDEDSSKRIVK